MASIHPLFKEQHTHTDMSHSNPNTNQHPPVLALSKNANLLDIVKRAAPHGAKVIELGNADDLMATCRQTHPGVLIADTDSGLDMQRTMIQLLQDLPELVVVMVGKSEESATLMKMTAAGQIYRFLLAPLAHGQTKLTLEAAMNQHLELSTAANRRANTNAAAFDDDAPRKSYLPTYIGLGVALVVIAGGAFFGLSRMGKDDATPAVTASSNSTGTAADQELALADAALAAGKLLEPPGESALDLYRSAQAIDPKNPRAQAGIDAVANKLLEQAKTALSNKDLQTTIQFLEQARDVSPTNKDVAFLDEMVAKERDLIAKERDLAKFTQASDLDKRVRALLADAETDMTAGRLISPSGNNAREVIADARRLDATNPAVAQAQRNLNNRVIDSARSAAEQGQTELAQTLLAAARQMGSAGADLSAVERSLSESRNKASADAAKAAAEKAAQQAQADRAAALAAAVAEEKAKAALATAAQTTTQAPKADNAKAATPALTPVKLVRTKTVAPVFPDEAKSRGISGWVDVVFTVMENGSVADVHAANAEPQGVFDFAATQAVEQWRFEAPKRDGKPTTQATRVRLRFDLPK